MRRRTARVGLAVVLAGLLGCAMRSGAVERQAVPVAVVELFTSEGCSSCPPADELLTRLAAEARGRGQVLVSLGFHVDYWDQLGWPDRFASREATTRQYAYARALREDRVYTPQMIVNGATGFVGSNREAASQALAAAFSKNLPTRVGLRAKQDGQALDVTVSTTAAPPRGVVLLAVTEDGLVSEVDAGENEGRTLHHDAVVRSFAVGPQRGNAACTLHLELPADLDRDRAHLVAVVQDERTARVHGAATLELAAL